MRSGVFSFGIYVSELSYVLYLVSRRGLAAFSESSRFTHKTSMLSFIFRIRAQRCDLLGELGPSPFAIAVAQPDAATSGFNDSHVIHPTHTVPMPYLLSVYHSQSNPSL